MLVWLYKLSPTVLLDLPIPQFLALQREAPDILKLEGLGRG